MQLTNKAAPKTKQWTFWIDRGGTFTDLIAKKPDGAMVTHKLLSENPQQYQDAAIQGIRTLMGVADDHAIPVHHIHSVRMGTTVATNALLEKKGEATLLITTKGFKDALRIAYQQRPDLFALAIQLPDMLYSRVIEADERMAANGDCVTPLDEAAIQIQLQQAYDQGWRSVAILLMHGYRYPAHEQAIARLANSIGFKQISMSHDVSPLIKYVSRGDTTVVDAYLSPVLRRYVDQVEQALPTVNLLFMQSNGVLTQAHTFQGKDAILSGPAGGVVGMVETAKAAGFEQLIGFDMGGTSTDVCHYSGNHTQAMSEYERTLETEIAGVRIRAPMMQIHTVAAGGGSILSFDGFRFRVGPDSAGANPGPVAYRKGTQLTVTDCNVLLGKLQPAYFPKLFGDNGDQALDLEEVKLHFEQFAEQIKTATGSSQSVYQIAEGFLTIAVENMANAIKKISVQRGYDIANYTLCSFGGAGGQHACLVADALGMSRIYLHPYAGVLSAYGMGLASIGGITTSTVDRLLDQALLDELAASFASLQGEIKQDTHYHYRLACRYHGSDSALLIPYAKDLQQVVTAFEHRHRQHYGFIDQKAIWLERIELEERSQVDSKATNEHIPQASQRQVLDNCTVFMQGEFQTAPVYDRQQLPMNQIIQGPAIITESTGTTVVEPGWQASLQYDGGLVLERYQAVSHAQLDATIVDPVMLEVFSNLFMSIAEQMGYVLERTAVSVNIKERLDFSCAVFDPEGHLVANAPHMPVHLGSMSESIKTIIRENQSTMQAGDAFMLNAPYNGGTHLPDVTVIKPVFDESDKQVLFYVAARGHHADIGGITPGSIPADSDNVNQEGVLIDNFKLVSQGEFQEQAVRDLLLAGPYPVRNIEYNIADLKAQLAACEKGRQELEKIIQQHSLSVVQAYMRYVQYHAEQAVRRLLPMLNDGAFAYEMDDGSLIQVKVDIDRENLAATIDFEGSSPQHIGNVNAPVAVVKAAVLYVFRCLVQADIPLNEGCLKPLTIRLPKGSMLNPNYPAAVVAGNVETSQYIVDALFAALSVMGAAQGTMNNVTWGNQRYQYYETICGGAGATANANGASAVHTHMTNSRLTDPEILESRFPVRLDAFEIRDNSGGNGQYHGGDGVIRRTRFLQAMDVNILSDHRKTPPYGMNGGGSALCGVNRLYRHQGETLVLAGKQQVSVDENDVLEISTPGGGGFGG